MSRDRPTGPRPGGAARVTGAGHLSSRPGERARVARELVGYAQREIGAAAAGVWPGLPVQVGRATTDGHTLVCRVAVGDGQTVCATYSLLGRPFTVLTRLDQGGVRVVVAAQRAYVDSLAGVLDQEAEQRGSLSQHTGVPVFTPIALRNGVLFTPWVDGTSLASRLLAAPDRTAEALTGVFTELQGLHLDPSAPVRRAARATPVRAVPAVVARATGGGPDRWLARDIAAGWTDHSHGAAEVRTLGLRSAARLGQLARRLDHDGLTAAGVSFGGVTPTRVIYPPGSARPVFVAPSLGPGGQLVDLGALLAGMHLRLAATPPIHEVTGQVVEGVEAWLCGQAASNAAGWEGWLATVLTLWAAELVSTLADHLTFPPGVLPLPAGTVAATRRARDVLTAVDAFTAVLLAEGPDAAMNTALGGMLAIGQAPDNAPQPASVPPLTF
jgi:hypothetical protein